MDAVTGLGIIENDRRRLNKQVVSDLVSEGLLQGRAQARQARKLTKNTFEALRDHLALV
jgi:hypothetical protein